MSQCTKLCWICCKLTCKCSVYSFSFASCLLCFSVGWDRVGGVDEQLKSALRYDVLLKTADLNTAMYDYSTSEHALKSSTLQSTNCSIGGKNLRRKDEGQPARVGVSTGVGRGGSGRYSGPRNSVDTFRSFLAHQSCSSQQAASDSQTWQPSSERGQLPAKHKLGGRAAVT